jgi:hypothetical protein
MLDLVELLGSLEIRLPLHEKMLSKPVFYSRS